MIPVFLGGSCAILVAAGFSFSLSDAAKADLAQEDDDAAQDAAHDNGTEGDSVAVDNRDEEDAFLEAGTPYACVDVREVLNLLQKNTKASLSLESLSLSLSLPRGIFFFRVRG